MVSNRTIRPIALAGGGMLALASAMGVGRFVYTPILPAMAGGLGLDPAQAGLLASANFVGYLLGAVIMSLPGLPGRRRSWILGGLLLSAMTTAASGALTAMFGLLAIRFGSGVASGFVLVATTAHVLDRLAEAGASRLSALLFAGPGLGILVSSVLVDVLAAAGSDWRSLWFASGALGAILLLAVVLLIPPSPRPLPVPMSGGVEPSAPSASPDAASFRRAVLSYGLFGFGYVITATFIVAMTRSAPRLASLEPVIWPLVGLAGIPSAALWNEVARRVGPSRAYAAACLIEALGIIIGVTWAEPAGIVIAALALGGTFIAVTALGLAVAKPFFPGDSRRLVGVMTVAFGIGQIVGPSFAGAAHGWTGSFALPSIVAAAALVLCAILVPRVTPARTG